MNWAYCLIYNTFLSLCVAIIVIMVKKNIGIRNKIIFKDIMFSIFRYRKIQKLCNYNTKKYCLKSLIAK